MAVLRVGESPSWDAQRVAPGDIKRVVPDDLLAHRLNAAQYVNRRRLAQSDHTPIGLDLDDGLGGAGQWSPVHHIGFSSGMLTGVAFSAVIFSVFVSF